MAFEFLYEDGEEEGVFVRGGRWMGLFKLWMSLGPPVNMLTHLASFA